MRAYHGRQIYAKRTLARGDLPAHTGSQRGFQWVAWRKDKMEFCAVSDAQLPTLNSCAS
jgi:hypothetical protein